MLKDHRRVCTGAECKVCRHLVRQRTAQATKLARGVEAGRRFTPRASGAKPTHEPVSGV
jgi:hypothetical protein